MTSPVTETRNAGLPIADMPEAQKISSTDEKTSSTVGKIFKFLSRVFVGLFLVPVNILTLGQLKNHCGPIQKAWDFVFPPSAKVTTELTLEKDSFKTELSDTDDDTEVKTAEKEETYVEEEAYSASDAEKDDVKDSK